MFGYHSGAAMIRNRTETATPRTINAVMHSLFLQLCPGCGFTYVYHNDKLGPCLSVHISAYLLCTCTHVQFYISLSVECFFKTVSCVCMFAVIFVIETVYIGICIVHTSRTRNASVRLMYVDHSCGLHLVRPYNECNCIPYMYIYTHITCTYIYIYIYICI